jgi:hypothetical protein
MLKRITLVLVAFALAVAGAKTYSVTLYQPSVLAGTHLKAGEYQIDLKDTKAVLRSGSVTVESPVKVEKAETKYSETKVRYVKAEADLRLHEIVLGGTNLKLVFE